MGNTMTKEAKVKIGFDIDKETAKKAMADTAKEAEKLEKAIGKVTDRYKGVKEEFAANKSAAITGTLGAITKAASGVSDEVAKMLSGFSVVTGVIEMFNSLNGSIQNSVKSLKEMRAVGNSLTQLQAAKLGGGVGLGASAGVAGTAGIAGAAGGAGRGSFGGTVAGAAAGGAVVSAAGQFATSTATDGILEKITEKIGKKAEKHVDDFIDAKFTIKKKPGSSLIPVNGGAMVPGAGGNYVDATWRFANQGLLGGGMGGSLSTGVGGALVNSPQQSIGDYVKAALANAGPSSVPTSGFGKWLHGAGTSFGSPKNRWNLMGGGLAGGLIGAGIGYGATGSGEGAAAGGGIGAVAGGAMNLMSGGGMIKGAVAALANPIGLALAGAAAAGASLLLVKGGKYGDKVADSIAGFFLSFVDNAADKAQKKLAAKQAEIARRENIDSVTLPIQNARHEALEGVRGEQLAMALRQQAIRNGTAGSGLDTSIEYSGQNLTEANSRLIQAQTARFRGDLGRGGDPAALRAKEGEALGDFQSQMAAQRQLTDARAAGQLAVLDPEIARARGENGNDLTRLNWMKSQQAKVGNGQIKNGDRGFTDVAMAVQFEKAEQSTRRLIELEKQRGEIKRSTLEVQKQEFAVYREQVRAGEQAARQALQEKEGMIESAKQEFGTMNRADRQFTMDIAKKLKTEGAESLTEDEKQFAMSNQNIFGSALKPQLSKLGDKVGFSDLQSLVGLDTKKESDALKLAQNLKVDVERNITAQLQVSEEKLAGEMASRFGPLIKSLTIILESKFEQMLKTSLNKIGGQVQDANLQK